MFQLPKFSPSTQRERCSHTGLMVAMCAHCNLCAVGDTPEPSTARTRRIDEPHYFKGRDTAEWRGIGMGLAEPRRF